MHYCDQGVLRKIVSLLDGEESMTPEFLNGDGASLMFRVTGDRIILIFTEGPTCTGSFIITEHKVLPEEKAMLLSGPDGSCIKLSTNIKCSGHINRYAISDKEVHYIHDAMIGEGGQYFESESGWGYVCDERGTALCFNDIEYVADRIRLKKGYTCFENSKYAINSMLISKNAKKPLR